MQLLQLQNYISGQWQASAGEHLNVCNPATAELLARVPISPAGEVDKAAQAAAQAAREWRCVPVTDRIQYLFKLKNLLEANIAELARTVTNECGKTYSESMGELRRGIENVEVAWRF